MSESTRENKILDRLTPQRKWIAERVLSNLNSGTGIWKQGWRGCAPPESGTSGKPYRGVNRVALMFSSMAFGYGDNRWYTFNQIKDKGWTFKQDKEGNSIAKGKSVPIEFFELRDRETKKPFDRSVLDGMTAKEQQEYMDKNVVPYRKYYQVFNADLIDGIPVKEESGVIDESARSQRVEDFIALWSDNECRISYGGDMAYYRKSTDTIQLPKREHFISAKSYYLTGLHEIGHSTGHESRLNRDLSGGFGSERYAIEELRAEFASMFLAQEFGIEMDDSAINNNSAYIDNWRKVIEEDPSVLFSAITDADKITKYITEKEKSMAYRTKYFAVVEEQDEYGETVYKSYTYDSDGGIKPLISHGFTDKDALTKEIEKMSGLEKERGKDLKEVTPEELKNRAKDRGELSKVEQQKSLEYVAPSEYAALEKAETSGVDMTGRGKESLDRLSDMEALSQAEKYYSGDETFAKLYNGHNVFDDEELNESGLMMRLAVICGNDKEQIIRLFKSSGQYKEDKPNGYYDTLADESISFVNEAKQGDRNSGLAKTDISKSRKVRANAKA